MSEAWINLTEADVLKEFTPAEKATLNNLLAATNNLADICTDASAEFRQAISDAGTSLGSTTTGQLPPGFRAQAVALARWRWLISIPQARALQTAERKEAAQKAEQLLADIATGKRPVAAPDSDTGGVAGPSFGTRGGARATDPAERDFTRTNQEGS